MTCHRCGKNVQQDPPTRVPRDSYCPECRSPLHCCKNCELYSPTAHNKCAEPAAEWVRDKEKGNFCEFFTPGGAAGGPSSDHKGGESKADAARSAFDNLFKKI